MMPKATYTYHARMSFAMNLVAILIVSRLHKRNFQLSTGDCLSDDQYKILAFDVKAEDGKLLVLLPPPDDLDALIGTSRWMGK
jgi:nitrite reductase (NAD(P)H)